MIRLLAILLTLLPAQAFAWGEYGHRTTASIAEENMSPAARSAMNRLFRSEKMLGTPKCDLKTIGDASVWPDCIRRDRMRWGYTAPWHYQNLNICKSFDLKSACRDGNCVSAQIDRNAALLGDKSLPAHVRLEALAFLVHFVGDLHMPLHSGSRDDLGGNRVKASYGYIPDLNLHWIWDGYFAERAISSVPDIIRKYDAGARDEQASGTSADWSLESYNLAKEVVYPRALDGRACGEIPENLVWDEADVAASEATLRLQVQRAGLRLARLIDQALGNNK